MATELVAQLRLVRPKARYEYAKDHFLMIGAVMREAADTIERLERELADMTSDYLRVHKALCDLKYPETAHPDVPSNRCEHGVWAGDVCYKCDAMESKHSTR